MQPAEILPSSESPKNHLELVRPCLMKNMQGEVLIIHTNCITTVCCRSAPEITQEAISWLLQLKEKEVTLIAGSASNRGGLFRFVTKDQAFKLIASWLFEEI